MKGIQMNFKEEMVLDDEDAQFDEDLQLAENSEIDEFDDIEEYSQDKRLVLEKTKILRHSWSIKDINAKIKTGNLILDPNYQRQAVWNKEKKISFIESLLMGLLIPPIYVVEVPSLDILDINRYEVVDGKQRLLSIKEFLAGSLTLEKKYLEYFSDIFGDLNWTQIYDQSIGKEYIDDFLSSVLDIYAITASSPEETKYDIFARLNKGTEKLRVNEIRKAIYRSKMMEKMEEYINQNYIERFTDSNGIEQLKAKSLYKKVFSQGEIKHYSDYGRFFASLAFYKQFNPEKLIINGYNSRPRDMINKVLSDIQTGATQVSDDKIIKIIEKTIKLKNILIEKVEEKKRINYYIDSFIYFSMIEESFENNIDILLSDNVIESTFEKSLSTTKNVNLRIKRINEILNNKNAS